MNIKTSLPGNWPVLMLFAFLLSPITTISVSYAAIVDLHSHLASHLAYGFMLKGGTPDDPPVSLDNFTHEHKFHQHLYRDWLKKSGIQIHLMAALPNIFAFTRDQAWQQVEEQLKYVEEFARRYSDDFILAKNPVEAKSGLEQGKIVLLHAIEGGEYLLDSQADADHWAKRGVALIGPIHLIDIDYGDSCIMHGRKMLNWKGTVRRGWFGGKDRGLSSSGKDALRFMSKAGIVIDTAHMSVQSLDDSLSHAENSSVPLVLSHGFFHAIRSEERGITLERLQRLYKQGGLFGLTLGGVVLPPLEISTDADAKCPYGSIADFKRHTDFIETQLPPQTVLAIGSDSNGFVDHLAPCLGASSDTGVYATGLRTPMDFKPLVEEISPNLWQGSGERFLQIWQQVLDKASQAN